MKLLAPIKAPLNILDIRQVINSPPWLEWFQKISEYNDALLTLESLGDTVTEETAFGQNALAGSSELVSRVDHTHGTPTNPVPAHEAAIDPHTQYTLESVFVDHSDRHANGGADELNVAGLSGELADDQPALTHGNERHEPESVFPVGSLYGTLTYTNPTVILGYGTWELILIT